VNLKNLVFPRMGLWLWMSIALLGLIWFLAPHMVKVAAYKLALITIAAYIAYWISRGLEGGVRPHQLEREAAQSEENVRFGKIGRPLADHVMTQAGNLRRAAEAIRVRRCYIVCACMIAVALGS
jgi:hypothetical protein